MGSIRLLACQSVFVSVLMLLTVAFTNQLPNACPDSATNKADEESLE
jgi:hypothetical protein